jgi:hypothetical protein
MQRETCFAVAGAKSTAFAIFFFCSKFLRSRSCTEVLLFGPGQGEVGGCDQGCEGYHRHEFFLNAVTWAITLGGCEDEFLVYRSTLFGDQQQPSTKA